MERIAYDSLYRREKKHWWHRTRRKIVFDLIERFSATDSDKKILDIGCGTGLLLKKLQNFGKTQGMDCAQPALDYCKKRGLENVKKGDILDIPFDDNQFDIVLALDVLEHVKNDSKALKEINRVLKKNGIALIFVPAFQFLWDVHDEIGCHFRRYNRKALADKIQKENFRILKASYFNTFLFPVIAPARFLSRLFKPKKIDPSGASPGFLNPILYRIFLFESWLLKHLNFPFGVSILFVVKK